MYHSIALPFFHFLFCFFWFCVVAIRRPLFFFFVAHCQSLALAHALALSLSFVHLFARSTCLLSLPDMFLSHCNTLIYKDLFFLSFSASINMPNRIPMNEKKHTHHMNRMNCHWMTHTNTRK